MAGLVGIIDRSVRVRRAARTVANLINPLVLLIAGRRWMPAIGVLHHRGRRTGRMYSTPLMLRTLGEVVYVPRTFGANAAWYRNVMVAGLVDVTYRGKRFTSGRPEVVPITDAGPAFPRYERVMFRLLGISEFVKLSRGG
jgi:deazaflavin-dependent oxidoreductase (nitroreductase family)